MRVFFEFPPSLLLGRQGQEIQRISKVLQLPIVEEWSRAFPVGTEAFQIGDLVLVDAGAELGVAEERFEARLSFKSALWFRFPEFELLEMTARESAVQYDLHAKAL